MIPYGRHEIDAADVEAVVDVLEHQFLTQGEQVPRFEQALCDYTGARYAVAMNSGTSALHVACLALGVESGDIVWTTPMSFVASANCARYCGADVDFVDIDPDTRNLSLTDLSYRLQSAIANGRCPKVIVVVHYGGLSCDMKAIRALTEPYGIALIEDASHALGASYQGRPVGCGNWSDACVFSFHPVKSITSAEGGALLSNRGDVARRARLLACHGITRDPAEMVGQADGPWYYQQRELGYNYRLSDLHAALGVSQLKRLSSFIDARRQLARRYRSALADLPLQLPSDGEDGNWSSAWHLYPVEVLRHDRADVFEGLRRKGVGVNVHYIPIHLQPYYHERGFRPGDFPAAETFYHRVLTLPLFPSLSADEQSMVVTAVKECLT